MSSATKCDRCGEYYDKNTLYKSTGFSGNVNRSRKYITGVKTVIGESYWDQHYDLCDECLTKLFDFLDGRDK